MFIKQTSRSSPCGARGLDSVSQHCTSPAASLRVVAMLFPFLNSWKLGGRCQCQGFYPSAKIRRARIKSLVSKCNIKENPSSSALSHGAKVMSRTRLSIHCCVPESEWEEVGVKDQWKILQLHLQEKFLNSLSPPSSCLCF